MNKRIVVACVAFLTARAGAANVYVMSSGDPVTDAAVSAALTSRGHTVTVGVQFLAFDGTQSLAGFNTVYLQSNYNWAQGVMPVAGQQAVLNFVNAGGRLVTSEWTLWKAWAQGDFAVLAPAFASEPSGTYGVALQVTYDQATPDPVINAGLPGQLTFALESYAGTETYLMARAGATTYYTSTGNPGVGGLTGWSQGSGSVFCFSTTCGPAQLADSNFGRLFANVMGAGATGGCYANCDQTTAAPILNVNDFQCFLNRYAVGEPYANCDGSTAVPVLNVNDFQCFLNRYAVGC